MLCICKSRNYFVHGYRSTMFTIRNYPHITYCADGAHSRSRLALCIIKCYPHAVSPHFVSTWNSKEAKHKKLWWFGPICIDGKQGNSGFWKTIEQFLYLPFSRQYKTFHFVNFHIITAIIEALNFSKIHSPITTCRFVFHILTTWGFWHW